MKKKFLIVGSFILIIFICVLGINFVFKKDLTIDEILETKSYNYLSPKVKQYIKNHYEETGELLLTKDNAKKGEAYLNPAYIYYLDNDDKENYGIIPNELKTNYHIVGNGNSNTELPSKYDMRDVDGHNYVSPVKDQGVDGICWAYATNAVLESYYLKQGITRFFSEQQLNYATSNDGVDVKTNEFVVNQHYSHERSLGDGAYISTPLSTLIDGLGAVDQSWDNNHTTAIINHKKIPAYDVYNYNNSIVEVDEATIFEYDPANLNDEEKQDVINVIKRGIMQYSGASVSIFYDSYSKANNRYHEEDVIVHDSDPRVNHALQLIGWDDDYRYGFCQYNYSGSSIITEGHYYYVDGQKEYVCDEYGEAGVNVDKKGAWIFKNSWGDVDSFIYVSYDTYISEVSFITKYDTKKWDNSYDVYYDIDINALQHDDYIYGYKYSFTNIYIPENEKLFKIKLNNMEGFDFELYISNDSGNTFDKINSYSREFPGYMMLDFSNSDYIINNNTVIAVLSKNSMINPLLHAYTKNINSSVNAENNHVVLGLDEEDYNNNDYVEIEFNEHIKNIDDHKLLNIKLKNSNTTYLSNDSYEILNNYSYMNMITWKLRINASAFQKGIYYAEIYNDSYIITENTLNIDVDYLKTLGVGTKDNPWQITNTRQVNIMRKHPYDYYILKNDIDFEYDTQNENGLFYNNGKGFEAIEIFYGDLNGNNKTISNLFSTTGFIEKYMYNLNSKLTSEDIVGVHDLKMKNQKLVFTNPGYQLGGIVNYLVTENKQDINFNNLQVIDSEMEINNHGIFGGIVGLIRSANTYGSMAIVSSSYNNWYSNTKFTINTSGSIYVGGLIGQIDSVYLNNYVSFGNMLFEGKFDIKSSMIDGISDLVGLISSNYSEFNIINFIGNGYYEYQQPVNVKGIIGLIGSDSNSTIAVHNAITNLPTNDSDSIEYIDVMSSAKPYEIANIDYSNWKYYTRYGFLYFKEPDNKKTKEYLFNDYWYQHSDNNIKRIPVLRDIEKNYTIANNTINLNVGETLQLNNIENFTNNADTAHLVSELNCNLDVCNSVSDGEIVFINEKTIMGLKKGTTEAIYYNDLDGYINTVTINVINNNEYVISFIPNDGILDINSLIIKNGDSINYPIPTRDHYTFLGWYKNIEDDNPYNAEVFEENENINLYAKWEINGYTINFDSDGGSNVNSIVVDKNIAIGDLPNSTKKGYDFLGWYKNNDKITSETVINSNLDLIAKWKKTDYYIRFDTDGGLAVNNIKVHYDEKIGELPVPIKDGYVFKGWSFEKNNDMTLLTEEYIYDDTKDIIAYAIFEKDSYSVHYYANGGYFISYDDNWQMKKNYSSNRLYQNGKIDSFMTPYRDDNKKFIGWYTEPNGGKKSEIGEILTENISLYAHWADEAYTIYIHDDFYGGYNIYYFEPDSKFGILSTPTKEGYKFIGWYDEIDNGNLITSETIVNDYNEMHIYPHWIKTEQYTIFFDSNGGDDVQTTITIQNGYEYGDLPMPTKIGYGFLGWFTKKNGGTRIKPSDVFDISQDQVLYAHWLSPDLYRISFDSNGGSIVNSLIEKYPGEPYGELPVPTKDNYTFVGWYDDSIEGSKINSDTVFDGTANKVLYAHWREGILNECVVSFDTNGGSGIIDSVHLYTGDKITLPVVTKKGYTFINWTYNGDVVTENTNFDEISEATLIANWQVNNYIVHFDANGGNGTMEDIIMTYDKAKMLPENLFVRNGYSFVGWSKTYDGDVTYDSYSLVSNIGSQGTVTLYAVWQENPKETKLYFDFNGGEVLDEHFYQPLYLYDDETIYYFPEIKRDGYTFVNWMYNDTVVDNSTTFYDMGEVTIKANWQPNNYTITFDGNGGIGSMENITMTYDVTKTLPENSFVYDDKVFVGWGRTADGNVEYQNMEITKNIAFEGEVTLYAHWADVEENVCIVNFDGNGGVGDTRRIYLYGNEKIYQLPEVAKKGYTLISWTYNDNPVDTDTSFEGNSEVTLIANWQPNKYIVKFNKDYDEAHGTMSDIEMTYDVEYQLPLNKFTLDGMVFAGWYTGFGYIYNDGETVKNLITEGEIILTANWMEEEYVTTISFDANGGVGDIPNLTLFGEAINDLDRLPVVTKEGYTFVNWTYNDEPVTIYSEFIGIREVTFVANWHANNYVIKFDANGGDKTMSNLEMTYDITKNLTANNFTKDGYRFIGWSKEKDGKVDYQDKEAVKNLAFDSEVTLYAVWELIPIIEGNISFNPNGGVGDMMYIDAGESVNLPSCAFSYPGYHFIGWSKEKDGKVIYTDLQKNITDLNKETVLYAKWEKNNTDTISYIDNSFVQKADESLSITDYVKNLNANEEISILNRQGQKTTSGIIGTGFILQIRKDGKLISSKVIIVKGDVTGDGTSNIADVKKIADYTLTGDGLEYYDIYAAEVTNNITINIADVKRIADHTLNKEIDLWK